MLLPPPTKHNGAVQQNTTALCNDTQQAHSHTKQQQSGAACGLITLATKTKIQSAGRHHRPVPREVGGPVATPPAQYGAGTSWSHTVQVMDRKGATVPHVLEPHNASRRDTRRRPSHFGALGRRDAHATARGTARNVRAHDTQRTVASRTGCVTRHGMMNAFEQSIARQWMDG